MAAQLAALDRTTTALPAFVRPAAPARPTGMVVSFTGTRVAGADPLDAIAETVVVERDQMLFSEGDVATSIHRVVDGTVRVYKLLPDGRRQIVGFMQAGDLMGLTAGACHLYSAEAVTTCTLQRIPRNRIDALMDAQPSVARRLHQLTAAELIAAQDHMLLLGRKTAVERVASFLLVLAGRSRCGGKKVKVPMSRTDIADHLGLTTETVSRAFSKLKTTGQIRLLEGGAVEIVDRECLTETAECAA